MEKDQDLRLPRPEKAHKAFEAVKKEARSQAQRDVKEAAGLHKALMDGDITHETAKLNSPWRDLLDESNEGTWWRFESIWQGVQHHLSRLNLYPSVSSPDLHVELACALSLFWLRAYADFDGLPSEIASKVEDLYTREEFEAIYQEWYENF